MVTFHVTTFHHLTQLCCAAEQFLHGGGVDADHFIGLVIAKAVKLGFDVRLFRVCGFYPLIEHCLHADAAQEQVGQFLNLTVQFPQATLQL